MEKQLADQLQCYDVLSVYQRVQTLALVTRLAERVPSMAAYASRIWDHFLRFREGDFVEAWGLSAEGLALHQTIKTTTDWPGLLTGLDAARTHSDTTVCLQEKRRIREHFEGVLEFCFDMESWESALRAVKLSDL